MNTTDKRKKLLMAAGGVIVAVVLYFLYGYIFYVHTDNAQIEGHSVMLAPKIGGYVTNVKVIEGQKVKKGDVLIEIDERDYQNTLNQIRGDLTSIEARLHDAEKNFKRISELYSKSAVSSQQFDSATATRADIKAKYESMAAQVAQAELNLQYTKLRAPTNGFIAKRSVEVGALAAPGVPLLGFVDAEDRWVIANFKETEIEHVKVGKKVDIDVDAISGKSFHGTVESISSATGATFTLLPPDNATGNFTKVVQRVPVKIHFQDLSEPDVEVLRAGLSALVRVHRY